MKRYCSILITLFAITFLSVTAFPQKQIKLKVKEGLGCGFDLKKGFYYRGDIQSYIVRQAVVNDKSEIYNTIEEIKKSIGIDAPFDIYITAKEDNAFAGIDENGKRFILADLEFLDGINKNSGTDWGAISILAHEVGHHIAGLGRGLQGELDADYWSGYALQKLGANKNPSCKAIMKYGTEEDTESHPNKYLRKSNIEKGWEDAKKGTFDTARCKSCKD